MIKTQNEKIKMKNAAERPPILIFYF